MSKLDKHNFLMSVEILSVRVDVLDDQGIISRINEFLTMNSFHQITPVNPEFIMAAQHDEDLQNIAAKSDLNVPDGVGLQLAARILGVSIGQRVTGVDLTCDLAKIASKTGHSIFLLGAANGVAQKVADNLKATYPGLKIAGAHSGSPSEQGIVNRINSSGADILLVAFGVPKQEKFISENRERLNVKIAMCVGGTFDFIAGNVPRAPRWMRQIGLEWVFRLMNQPKRINRVITATVRFPIAVVLNKFLKYSRNGKNSIKAGLE